MVATFHLEEGSLNITSDDLLNHTQNANMFARVLSPNFRHGTRIFLHFVQPAFKLHFPLHFDEFITFPSFLSRYPRSGSFLFIVPLPHPSIHKCVCSVCSVCGPSAHIFTAVALLDIYVIFTQIPGKCVKPKDRGVRYSDFGVFLCGSSFRVGFFL